MKLQLDTVAKTIRLEEAAILGEFFAAIDLMFPDDAWKEFKIETNTIINWSSPVVINPFTPYVPWNQPWYTSTQVSNGNYLGGAVNHFLNDGTYCVEFRTN